MCEYVFLKYYGKSVTTQELDSKETYYYNSLFCFLMKNSKKKTNTNKIFVLFSIHLWRQIDHSVVESFGAKGKNVITARVYPTLAINEKAHLYVFNRGTSNVEITGLTAWSMKKANIA